ncbi:hypothetical protein ILT44_16410 [Microvirga sp. BT689]|uniref:YciI family protein n=1 Tax=Microvirga arvi TaxID=2778731 RepID=UPI0019510DA7|nr:YciI family protein [Microvirga arvi]MBM6581781.1 hypothetical protein [Microvirga arvi]
MPLFFCRLVPPRSTFPFDITPDERDVMMRHAEHWRAQAKQGKAIAFGPVLDPKGPFGIGIAEYQTEEELRALWDVDPAVASGRGFTYEIHPMPSVILREAQAGRSDQTND